MTSMPRLKSPALQRAIIALLLGHLLAVVAMAGSSRLHQWVHHDADANGHECAVTLFLHGGYAGSAAPLILVASMAFMLVRFERPRPVWVASLFLSRGVLEHAPPAA